MEGNRILKEQVTMLHEALEVGKKEWKSKKRMWQTMKESITRNKDVIISKATQVDTQVSQQTNLSKEKERKNNREDGPKEIKARAEDANGYIKTEEEEDASPRRAQEREHKERKDREIKFIIRGIRDYGKNESTLNLTRYFLKEKLHWKGKIYQARKVWKICEERPQPIKVTMASVQDKHQQLGKKLLKSSHFFLDEDLTNKQQEE